MTFRRVAVILWTGLFLVLAEVVVEARASRRGWDTLLFGFESPQPTASGERRFGPTPGFPFRSEIIDADREGEVRIWIASASYAEDIYQPADRIFAHRTQELLRSRGIAARVLNASRAGLTIPRNLATLTSVGPVWHPDLVVLYQLSQDITDLAGDYLGSVGAPEAADLLAAAEDPSGAAAPVTPTAPFLVRRMEQTTTFALLQGNLTSRVTQARLLQDSLPTAARDAFRARVVAFLDEADRLDAVPVCVTLATSYVVGDVDRVPRDVRLGLLRYNPYLSMKGWLVEVDRLNGTIRSIAASGRCHLVDVAGELAGQPQLFRDFVHFSPKGHERVADVLAEGLEKVVRETRGPESSG